MKRALLVLLLVAGCKPLEVPQGRYACDPSGDRSSGSEQCPGTSRCGLEGYCHDVGETSVWWKCADATDCESGWQCGIATDGVSRECHDPSAPQDHRCLTNADCSGSWTCGLDTARLRRCHDPMKPKAWPCEATSDCVGGWQCGVASTGGRECHDPMNPQAWVCLSNDDCLGGWQCGLNDLRTGRECHDPNMPRSFACERDSDCVGGFRCGLNDTRTARECHDPNRPRSFACEQPTDCLAGWQCGLNDTRNGRECHDPNMPREFACLVDADCVANWSCGLASNRLQRECHDPGNPQAWACNSDQDCLDAWRCDSRALCTNPREDALLPTSPFDAGADRINPVDTNPISRAAVSVPSPLAPPPYFALERDGRLEVLVVDTARGAIDAIDLGPSSGGPLLVQSPRSLDLQFSRFVEVIANRVYQGHADGGVTAFLLGADGGFTSRRVRNEAGNFDLPVPVTTLRHGVADRGLLPPMVGFSDSPAAGFLIFDGPGAALNYHYPSSMLRPNNRIHDLVDVTTRDGGLECVLALDEAGVWARQFMTDNSWNFEQVHTPQFGNDTCAPVGLKVTGLASASPTHVTVRAVPRDGGPTQVAVWSLTPMLTRGTGNFDSYCTSILEQPCTPGDAIPFSVELGPCDACPVGVLEEVVPIAPNTGTTPELEVRCGTSDGGLPTFFRLSRRALTSTACDRRPLVGSTSIFGAQGLEGAEQVTLGRFLVTGPAGQLWFGDSVSNAAALSFDRAATGVAQVGTNPREVLVIGQGVTAVPVTRFGLLSFSSTTVSAVARNEPSWVISSGNLTTLAQGPTLADAYTFALPASPLQGTPLVRRARAATGASVAIVSSAGTLLAAEVDAALNRQVPFVLLSSRAVSTSAFTDLAFPLEQRPDAGVWLEGYGLTVGGVTRVTAESPTRWSLQAVPLPANLNPIATWFEGTRARIGMSDGTIVSMPSSVRIAEPLPGGAVTFGQVCTHQFALSPVGLFRVTTMAGSPVGSWERVPLPPTFSDLLGGSLHAVAPSLYVFTRTGETARLDVPCP
ncbi:MAG: hypothetical protein ABTQ32_12390 [Myxococcaceae bacterium]